MVHALADKDVVLLGIGHTNAHILRMWRMHPPENVRLTCVSNEAIATYSGMLPGVLAGQYRPASMEIDLVRLTAASGARLVIDDVTGLDVARQELQFADRAPLRFDVLSIGVGSVPASTGVRIADAAHLVPIKPMQTFLTRLDAQLMEAAAERAGVPIRIAVVGGGAGGVEVALCLPAHLRTLLGAGARFDLTLVTADEQLLPHSMERTARRVERLLHERGVLTEMGRRVVEVAGRTMTLHDGSRLDADVILWATGAGAAPLLRRLGLPADEGGFLLTHETLQTTAGAPVFVVGDAGSIAGTATPKAGVYAVRQGPVLWDNIHRALSGAPLRRYVPQRRFLKLLNTGDGRAIGEWQGLSFEGGWCWRLKDAIDSRFMEKYQNYTPMAMTREPDERAEREQMRCAGCGGKVGAGVLARVLERLDIPPSEHVLLGLDRPGDAAVLMPPGHSTAVTVDFFAAPFDDPYLVGRLAALNAASDLFAVGASPWAALAMVTLPPGSPRQQEDLLFQVLSGSLTEFRTMGATLVGGHTIEGPRVTVGFTVLGTPRGRRLRTKAGLRAGDHLVLTKPLGTGVLLAAHMQARCRAGWFGPLLASMLVSNGPAAACLEPFDVRAVTDVTGFGLAGHLLEMLRSSDMAANVDLEMIPLLPGAEMLLDEGLESTLAGSNRGAESDIESGRSSCSILSSYRSLFDPQTGGGLLIGISPSHVDRLLVRLASLGHQEARVIGEVVAPAGSRRGLRIT